MYKRLVIYLYYYREGEKKESCGYAKMNILNGECRMDLSVNHVPQMKGKQELYFLKKENGRLRGKRVMDTEMTEGVMNLKYICKCNNMAGMSIDDMMGILIYDGENIMKSICGVMRDEEIDVLDFAKEEKSLETEEIRHKNQEESGGKDMVISEESENSVYEYDKECLQKKAENRGADCVDEDKVEGCGMDLGDWENEQAIPVGTWQEKMFHVFPKIVLNIDGRETTGIKLKPHDIVWFPGTYWRLATNKFLLNGYYNYRYILFFKGTGEYEGRYFLGTPGCFGVNDAITAKKFGFTDFFMANGCTGDEKTFTRSENRNFGFWCREA